MRIGPGTNKPGGQLSDTFDISGTSGQHVVFAKPATVSFALEIVNQGSLENENLLRIYTRERVDGGGLGAWEPLRTRSSIACATGCRVKTRHLSPFVVLRSDCLP